jgi:hypothetical protein
MALDTYLWMDVLQRILPEQRKFVGELWGSNEDQKIDYLQSPPVPTVGPLGVLVYGFL